MTHRRDELAEDEEVEEGMDTLSELYITGARARGDGLSGRPMWLQGRDRKQGTNAALGSGFGGHQAESMTILDREVGRQGAGGDAFQISGGGRRRGPAGLSPMQSTVHDDLPSPKPKMLSSAAALPHAAGLSGGGAGRGRRAQQAGGVVGGVTGSAIRSAQSNESMRESWDSLTLFARGHAGRLAPSMSAKHGAHGKVSNSDRKRFGGNGNAEAATAKVHEDHAFGGRAGGQGIRESSLNRLGSAPVDGRGDEESGSPPWAGDRQVISAHGIKDPSIRLDLHPFHIPVLPAGRHLRFDIITTWGDPHYVGLSGIELFDGNGAAISISESDISADPADINILPGYGNDPRTVDKLVDGVNRTCDDLHMWLTPFTAGRHHYVFIDLGGSRKVSMLRIWNYNKSRIHSYRGARYLEVLLDERPIFKGEIQKAPGMLQGAEEMAENILFSTDEDVLCAIEEHDVNDINVNPASCEVRTPAERPKTSERPKTAGRNTDSSDGGLRRVGSGHSAHSSRSASSDAADGAAAGAGTSGDWAYLSQGSAIINGPTERLPPEVVVSETGNVSREPAQVESTPGHRAAVGADGRPMTSAGSLQPSKHLDGAAQRSGMQLGDPGCLGSGALGVGGRGDALSGRVLTVRLLSNWGDVDAVGLCGLEVLCADGSAVRVSPDMISVSVECDGADVSSHLGSGGGGYLDPAYAARIFSGDYSSKVKQDMWLLPQLYFNQNCAVYSLKVDFGRVLEIHSLRVWNYNSSLEGSYRGVKRALVMLDQARVSPPVGYLVRKGPGPLGRSFSYSQTIRLQQLSERIGTPYIFFGSSSGGKAPASVGGGGGVLLEQGGAVLQEYEPPTLPSGFVFKFVLMSTWDDRFYIGLDGLELYDQFDRPVPIKEETLHVVCIGGGSSVADLAECAGDPRTPEKLVDGHNGTVNDEHTWLAPYERGSPTVVCLIFDEPVTLSLLKVWNYSKTPGRGVRELELSIDDVLVYKGHVRKFEPNAPPDQRRQGQSILFTNDRRVVARERPNVYVHFKSETEDMLFIDSASGEAADDKAKRCDADVRPSTSVLSNFAR